jgi:deoxyadenosine/deoxycytidine kinase
MQAKSSKWSKPIIWIEGVIGAGKTTLARTLGEALGMRVLEEPVDSNPYLTLFYKDPKRWAYAMQIHLMGVRYGMQQLAAYEAVSGTSNGVLLDRGLPGDRVFARLHTLENNISALEWETYQRWYDIMTCSLIPPSLMIFLDTEPEIAHERLKERDRDAEKGVPLKYIQDLRKGYLDLMVEIESGRHPWARGMELERMAWNTDHLPVEPLIEALRDKYRIANT